MPNGRQKTEQQENDTALRRLGNKSTSAQSNNVIAHRPDINGTA